MPSELDLKAAEALDQALAAMNNEGAHWIKGRLRQRLWNYEMAYCSIGALHEAVTGWDEARYVVTDKPVFRRATRALVDAYRTELAPVSEYREGDMYTIEMWNDDPDTTWEKVEKRFKRAATRLRNQ